MKLSTYNIHKNGALDNIKIKKGIDQLIQTYSNNPYFKRYTKDEIIKVVIDECIIDAQNNSNELLDFTLGERHINYLNQLRRDLLKPVESFFQEH